MIANGIKTSLTQPWLTFIVDIQDENTVNTDNVKERFFPVKVSTWLHSGKTKIEGIFGNPS
jgi:hypothetical protein